MSEATAFVHGSEAGWSWRLRSGDFEACDWARAPAGAPLGKPILAELAAILDALRAAALLIPGIPLKVLTRSPRVAMLCRGEAQSPDPDLRNHLEEIRTFGGERVEAGKIEDVTQGAAPDRCECGEGAWAYGPDGTPWCRTHRPPCPCGGGCAFCGEEAAT